jgi:hypothetical protein
MSIKPPGIYFGLSPEDYHADESIGSSGMVQLINNPSNFSFERFTAFGKPRSDTQATKMGRALHAYVLEGKDEFETRFCVKPELPPDTLVTLEDLKNHAKNLGLTVSGTKSDLAKRIRVVDRKTPIELEIMEDFHARRGNRDVLSDDDYARVCMSGHAIALNKHLAFAFTGGFPEVSVFWTQKGAPMKARFDYLKIKLVVDLKSMANWRGIALSRAWGLQVASHDYDIQAAHYMNGRAMAAQFVRDGDIYVESGKAPGEEWLKQFAAETDPNWLWVVYQSDGAPISKGFRFPTEDRRFQTAQVRIANAIDTYNQLLAEKGRAMWLIEEPIEDITEDDLPSWFVGASP